MQELEMINFFIGGATYPGWSQRSSNWGGKGRENRRERNCLTQVLTKLKLL